MNIHRELLDRSNVIVYTVLSVAIEVGNYIRQEGPCIMQEKIN